MVIYLIVLQLSNIKTSYECVINTPIFTVYTTILLLLLGHFSRVRLCVPHRWKPTRLPRP